ncbi:MAG: hydratase [Clostridia bacterium]|nr:hydratase [Clostridia bacterium]
MIKLIDSGVYYYNGEFVSEGEMTKRGIGKDILTSAYKGTMAYGILSAHNTVDTVKGGDMRIRFDAMASHDITYVGIIQTAKASGLERFPIPYVLTNCHNSLCAVGGTINEDDHVFGLSAAKKYGGIYVPPHQAVIHTFMRENMSGVGKMILGSDSHTRYGALGTMAVGEGGPELVKQLLKRTYDIKYPDVIAIRLSGKVRKGVGPQDVALAIIGAVFKKGFVKNKVMEFVGDGIKALPIEFRNGIDVMTTETTCLSSIWATDDEVKGYYATHGRLDAYRELKPEPIAYYDGMVDVDLNKVEPMIALPFHPSNVYKLQDVIDSPYDILSAVEKEGNAHFGSGKVKFNLVDKIKNGKVYVEQGIIAGCAGGTYDNVIAAANILKDGSIGSGVFTMSVYPSSQPIYYDLLKKGAIGDLMKAGVTVKTAFCGPCFGAGDVPANNALSIRHTTRNFESREGSKPGNGQIASVALMDARSIAMTAKNGGALTSALNADYDDTVAPFEFDKSIYEKRCYYGWEKADGGAELTYGPNICDWPKVIALTDNLIVKLAAVINDPVTTTDELIPSGETSSYRSNPMKLAEFALSRKEPRYVGRAKEIADSEKERQTAGTLPKEYADMLEKAGIDVKGTVSIGSGVYAVKPGDGSAREQAASCQRVLGGVCNIAREYATKRYRSNLINWGMIPFLSDDAFEDGDVIYVENVRKGIIEGDGEFSAKLIREGASFDITLRLDRLTADEKDIISKGCLINYYKSEMEK